MFSKFKISFFNESRPCSVALNRLNTPNRPQIWFNSDGTDHWYKRKMIIFREYIRFLCILISSVAAIDFDSE